MFFFIDEALLYIRLTLNSVNNFQVISFFCYRFSSELSKYALQYQLFTIVLFATCFTLMAVQYARILATARRQYLRSVNLWYICGHENKSIFQSCMQHYCSLSARSLRINQRWKRFPLKMKRFFLTINCLLEYFNAGILTEFPMFKQLYVIFQTPKWQVENIKNCLYFRFS